MSFNYAEYKEYILKCALYRVTKEIKKVRKAMGLFEITQKEAEKRIDKWQSFKIKIEEDLNELFINVLEEGQTISNSLNEQINMDLLLSKNEERIKESAILLEEVINKTIEN